MRSRLLAALLGLALVVSGCVTLQRGGIFPQERNDVFVEIFDNATFFRDVGFQLTNQIVSEILSRPGLHLTSKEDAEILVTGRVTKVRQSVLSENPEQIVTSESTTVSVVVNYRDAKTGEIFKTQQLSQRGEFVPTLGQSVETAREQAFILLARDIVRGLEVEF